MATNGNPSAITPMAACTLLLVALIGNASGVIYNGRAVSLLTDQSLVVAFAGADSTVSVNGRILFLGTQIPHAMYGGEAELIVFDVMRGCYSVLYVIRYIDCPILGAMTFRGCRHAMIHRMKHSRVSSRFLSGNLITIEHPAPIDTGIYYLRVTLNDSRVSDVFKATVVIEPTDNSTVNHHGYHQPDLECVDFNNTEDETAFTRFLSKYRGSIPWSGVLNETLDDGTAAEETTTSASTTSARKPTEAPLPENVTRGATTTPIPVSPSVPTPSRRHPVVMIVAAVVLVILAAGLLISLFRRFGLCRRCKRRRIYNEDGSRGSASASNSNIAINGRYLQGVAARNAAKNMDVDAELMEKLRKKLESINESSPKPGGSAA
uniref:Envelope glycoprotein I n=1 Tax=Anatid alphaherpesvirus 2 TaxID=3080522 RepID=A0AAU0K6S6_9ALPH